MATVVLDNIVYKKKEKQIVDSFSYNFLANKIYALVGKDNSGIDYLFDIIASNTLPTSGNVYFEGKTNSLKDSPRICYIKTFPALLSINGIFEKMKEKYPHWDNFFAYSILQNVGIKMESKYGNLSERNKDIVKAAVTIASNADVKLLFNPVEKADLKVRADIYKLIYKHHENNPSTYIISTNIIDELSYTIDQILLVNDGKLIEHISIEQAKRSFFEISGKAEVVKSLITGMRIIGYEERGQELTVCTNQKLTKDLTRKFQKYMVHVSEVNIQKLLIYLLLVKEKKDYFN